MQIQVQADAEHESIGNERRSAVADKGQGDTNNGYQRGRRTNIDEEMSEVNSSDADDHQLSERVFMISSSAQKYEREAYQH